MRMYVGKIKSAREADAKLEVICWGGFGVFLWTDDTRLSKFYKTRSDAIEDFEMYKEEFEHSCADVILYFKENGKWLIQNKNF